MDAASAADGLVPQCMVMGQNGRRLLAEAGDPADGRNAPFLRTREPRPVSRSKPSRAPPRFLFTGNETNSERLFRVPNTSALCEGCVRSLRCARRAGGGESAAGRDQGSGLLSRARFQAGKGIELRFRLSAESESAPIDFDAVFAQRIAETNLFYGMDEKSPPALANRPPGRRRSVVVEAVLSLRGAGMAGRRSRSSRAAGRSAGTAATANGSTSTIAT